MTTGRINQIALFIRDGRLARLASRPRFQPLRTRWRQRRTRALQHTHTVVCCSFSHNRLQLCSGVDRLSATWANARVSHRHDCRTTNLTARFCVRENRNRFLNACNPTRSHAGQRPETHTPRRVPLPAACSTHRAHDLYVTRRGGGGGAAGGIGQRRKQLRVNSRHPTRPTLGTT